jgi:phage host-nuclease inhibitor protein Gam
VTLPSILTELEPEPEQLETGWLDDDRRAEWAMRRLRELDQTMTDLDAQADVWISEIREWLHERITPSQNEAQRLTDALLRYALAVRERDDRKTVKLPSGTLTTRQASEPTVKATDDKALLAWCEEHLSEHVREDVVKEVKSVRISELRKQLVVHETDDGDLYVTTDDGELVPGVTAERGASMAHLALAVD